MAPLVAASTMAPNGMARSRHDDVNCRGCASCGGPGASGVRSWTVLRSPRTPAPPPSRGRGSRNLPSRGDLVPKQRGKSGTPGTYTLETKRDIAGQSAPAARTGRLHSIPLSTVGRTIGHEPVDPTFKALCRKGPGDLPSGRVRPGAGRRVAPSRKLSPHSRRRSRRPGLGEIRKKTFETSHGSRRISPRTHEISPAPEIGASVRTAFTPGVAFPQVWL